MRCKSNSRDVLDIHNHEIIANSHIICTLFCKLTCTRLYWAYVYANWDIV